MNDTDKRYNQFDLTIETLTPLHIGNDEKLTSVGEFITTADKIRYLKLDELNEYLAENNYADDYSDKIIYAGVSFDTTKTLTEYKVEIEDFIQKETKLNGNNLNPLNNNMLHIFHHSKGKKYIPGSTFKGMIKTVLLFHYLNNDRRYLIPIEKTIKEKFPSWHKSDAIKWLNAQWESAMHQETFFNNREFNLLRPSDSMFIDESSVQIEQVKRQHLYGIESESLDWLQETIENGTEIKLSLKIIPGFSAPYSALNSPYSTLLFYLINEYSLKMIEFEMDLISQSFYDKKSTLLNFLGQLKEQILSSNNEFAICRIGKGKSIYFQTILSLLDKDSLKILIHKLKKSEDDESDYFPSTRVLTAFDEMLGWIKIKESFDFIDNEVGEIKEKSTLIKANFISQKLVSFRLNGAIFKNIHLVNPLKKIFKVHEEIEVIIWQINSDSINQVKIE